MASRLLTTEDKVSNWLSRIGESEKKRDRHKKAWENNYVSIYNDWWEKVDDKGLKRTSDVTAKIDKYRFDLLLAYLKTEIPSLLFIVPRVYLTAKKWAEETNPNAQKLAKKTENEINKVFNEMDGLDTELEAVLIDAHASIGCIKTYASAHVVPHPKADKPIMNERKEIILDTDRKTPLRYSKNLDLGSVYHISRVSPFNLIVAASTMNNVHETLFIGEEIIRTLEELKHGGMYDKTIISRLSAKLKRRSLNRDKQDWQIDVKLYELYDLVNEKILVLCDQIKDEFLRNDDIPPELAPHPYSILKFNEIPGQFWPYPDCSSGRIQQKDYTKLRRWQGEFSEKCRQVYRIDPTKFADPKEKDKIGDGISDKYEAKEGAVSVGVPDLQTNVSHKEHMEACLRDFDESMGQSAVDRSRVGTAELATELEIAQMKGKAREGKKISKVKKFMAGIVENLLIIMDNTLPEKKVLMGLDASSVYTKENLNPDVEIDIDIESKAPKNRAIDRKQLNEAMANLAANPIYMQSKTLLDMIFELYEVKDKQKVIDDLVALAKAQAEGETKAKEPRISFSISPDFKWMPEETGQALVGVLFELLGKTMPKGPGEKAIPPGGGDGGGTSEPSKTVEAGTEGIEPAGRRPL